ncbi:hypothetical protein, partial [Thiohalocapsa sp.]|uniref:hypothetical protein n=1 Tax=Thiohalocapsa sp. TaxID=2497641 RepID=UPI0025D97463
MRRFVIAESEADFTSHAGLGLIGQALERHTDLAQAAAAVAPLRSDAMPHRDLLACYVALLCRYSPASRAWHGLGARYRG